MAVLRIIRSLPIEDLCNGSTPDSDSVCGGSNPSSSAKKSRYPFGYLLFLFGGIQTNLNAARMSAARDDLTERNLDVIESLIFNPSYTTSSRAIKPHDVHFFRLIGIKRKPDVEKRQVLGY